LSFGIFAFIQSQKSKIIMGRGDKRTAKGKRFKGSYGNSRPQSIVKKVAAPKEEKVAKPVKKAAPKEVEKEVIAKKAPPRKTAAKKAAE
jgi:30S ribosomal protein S31